MSRKKITTEEAIATVVTAVIGIEVLLKLILSSPKALEILKAAGEANLKRLDNGE